MPEGVFGMPPQPPQPPSGEQTQTIPTACQGLKNVSDKLGTLLQALQKATTDATDLKTQVDAELAACIAANGGGMLPPG